GRPSTGGDVRRDLEPPHGTRRSSDGRRWPAFQSRLRGRDLQRGPAVSATSAASNHRSLSVNESALYHAVAEVLQQGESLLCTIDDANYTRKLRPAFNSAIGGHYRHCIDHLQCLLRGLKENEINYDHCESDRWMETDRELAVAYTKPIMRAYH